MREFNIAIGAQTATATTTAIFINPTASTPGTNLEFLRFWCGQNGTTTSAQQNVTLETQVTSFPTVTAFTPQKKKFTDTASIITGNTSGAAGTCGVSASTDGGGTQTIQHADTFNNLNGWLLVYQATETFIMPASSASGLGLRFPTVPGTTSGWTYGLTFREV